MNKTIAKHRRALELLVLLLFGEGLLLSRLSFAFVTSNSVGTIILEMSTDANDREAARNTAGKTPPTVPLIDIGATDHDKAARPTAETSRALVGALQDSGFAIVRSPLLTKELQSGALEATTSFLATTTPKATAHNAEDVPESAPPLVEVIEHPTDPKVYAMLDSDDQFDVVAPDRALSEYVRVLRSIKRDVLRLIAVGLGMDDPFFFANLHDEDNDTLRLITYHPTHSEDTGNRCKEHSDYGTITLLSTDGVSGLELFHDGKWLPVPFVEGTLVVNVGSLLSSWTQGSLRATLHRVAGPASRNSCSDREILREAVHVPRTSLAFFADPNKDVSESLEATTSIQAGSIEGGMSVAEYISWRSGGDGAERSGVSFTEKESERIRETQ
jgi:isopenicillin N synthase-like dioxygenase